MQIAMSTLSSWRTLLLDKTYSWQENWLKKMWKRIGDTMPMANTPVHVDAHLLVLDF